jgi:hypothetical protein
MVRYHMSDSDPPSVNSDPNPHCKIRQVLTAVVTKACAYRYSKEKKEEESTCLLDVPTVSSAPFGPLPSDDADRSRFRLRRREDFFNFGGGREEGDGGDIGGLASKQDSADCSRDRDWKRAGDRLGGIF